MWAVDSCGGGGPDDACDGVSLIDAEWHLVVPILIVGRLARILPHMIGSPTGPKRGMAMPQTAAAWRRALLISIVVLVAWTGSAWATYTNMEVSQVHPIALTPDGQKLLVVNTPAARLEVFAVAVDGSITHSDSISVGMEPVSVVARTSTEAWVVNNLSDSVSIIDLGSSPATVTETLDVGDEPTDVVFAAGKAFVAVSGEDTVKVYTLAALGSPPQSVDLFSDAIRALAVSEDGLSVHGVALRSGNQTTVVNGNIIANNTSDLDPTRLAALGLNDLTCDGPPNAYPPLPSGIVRNPALTDPLDGVPRVGLIVRWSPGAGQWQDDAGQNWNSCLPVRLPDHDLFTIDAITLAVTTIDHVGTSLFDVAVQPGTGKLYVPNTDARNFVRFEHPLGVRGHVVDNRLTIVDPGMGTVDPVDLNVHIDRNSDPATNLAERQASVSQPGMMVWSADGSVAYLSAIGSRKVFRVDGGCTAGACIFGNDRSAPDAVEVGEGPTGLALLETANRLYVLNRFSNSVATVDTTSLAKLTETPLLDPSPATVKDGRRFLYDGILGSGHGDAACSSCHLSGDMDGLAWDLGNPEGDFKPYGGADNVRFVQGGLTAPTDCDPGDCASKSGFDPQKGPMVTQSLRGMLEPLHWRGDRATMNAFNPAFVDLMGTADIGPVDGKAAGLSAVDMERFRQFALGVRFPPNPHRRVDDSVPTSDVLFADRGFAGNPAAGENVYMNRINDGFSTCRGCHSLPFGAAGGKLGGVTPQDPPLPDTAALFNGENDKSLHSDLKIAHLRNMYVKLGPTFGDHVAAPPESKSGFGFAHDGSGPGLTTFFSLDVFAFDAADQAKMVRDIAAFTLHFPSDLKPAAGRMVTVPAGTPPTGTLTEEALITTLIGLGDVADLGRHCELTAFAIEGGRVRHAHLSSGQWIRDLATDPPVGTTALRDAADGPVTFLCATLGAGPRLGGDRDEDGFLDGDDCVPADPTIWAVPGSATGLRFEDKQRLAFQSDPAASRAPAFDLASGHLSDLRSTATIAGASCLAGEIAGTAHDDLRADPPTTDGFYYLARGRNGCGVSSFGTGHEVLDTLVCP